MKTDKNGCSVCPQGQERYESYWSDILGKEIFQYDYRATDGRLFSTVAGTLEKCRERRDAWAQKASAQ